MSKRWTLEEDEFLRAYFDAAGDMVGTHDLGRTDGAATKRVQFLKDCGAWDVLGIKSLSVLAHRVATGLPVDVDERDLGQARDLLLSAKEWAESMGVDAERQRFKPSFQDDMEIIEVVMAIGGPTFSTRDNRRYGKVSRSAIFAQMKEAIDATSRARAAWIECFGTDREKNALERERRGAEWARSQQAAE